MQFELDFGDAEAVRLALFNIEKELGPGWKIVEVRNPDSKSNPQLAYLYGHLALHARALLQNMGWSVSTKVHAVEIMKEELDFCRESINERTGEVRRTPISSADAGKDEMHGFIQKLFIHLLTEGCEVTTPEEWKERRDRQRRSL